ncbi:hypothetical protein HZS_1924 [Henneguya salminicola]|uniref:Cytosolic Fe-S cluster assembly factor NUBP2 homolog (Trinotate prediction) n=1 Tax=Henneguya salminicola TaxID=69463 RepID=A0A6G3MHE9_HENSL|nr:hypothetical protein HZS_1924 [Henneguya salminicola]
MYVLLVISGKGGVGKSSLSVLLSLYLNKLGHKVSLLDLDICGPSLGCFLGIKDANIIKNQNGSIIPYKYSDLLNCLSMSFLLSDPDAAIIWRGPRKNALIKEVCQNVDWGDSEFLIIDTPPGIQDEHITLAELFYNVEHVSALVITTPHELSIDDVQRQTTFCRRTGIKLLGIIENMKNFVCPNCKECFEIFQNGNVEQFCGAHDINYIGNLEILPKIALSLDCGRNIMDEESDISIETILKSVYNLLINV